MKNKNPIIVIVSAGTELKETVETILGNKLNDEILIINSDEMITKKQSLLTIASLLLEEEISSKTSYRKPTSDKNSINSKKYKKIPKNCKIWNIGKYEVIALNRKNAIRKALNLRKKERNNNVQI